MDDLPPDLWIYGGLHISLRVIIYYTNIYIYICMYVIVCIKNVHI